MTLTISRVKAPLNSIKEQQTAARESIPSHWRPAKNISHSSQIQLNPLSQTLEQITQELAKISDVDENRVHAIRQAIVEGRFYVNSENVAEKLMAFEENLQ